MNAIRVHWPRGLFVLDVSLELPDNGVTAILGPSGCGKTTLLRCIAGLEQAPEAAIEVGGECWQHTARGEFVPPWQRGAGYVFQEASLFDHLDVRGNLQYAERRARNGGAGVSVAQATELLGIGTLLGRRPFELSGGERQRVAIARALAARPRLLLLDEPLAAVDVSHRREILPWLETLRDELRIPMLYVTHAADEAARLASTLVLMRGGRVEAAGPLAATMARLDLAAAKMDDAGAVLEGRIEARDTRWHLTKFGFAGGALWLADRGHEPGTAVRVHVLARDVSLALAPPENSSIQNVLPCTVREVAPGPHPSQAIVRLQCGETALLARITARAADALALREGAHVWAQVKSAALVD
ncbi:molybdenum ABC transporter ATP-binding protein [Ramlibacter albus]|uniref:Molybdenum ABC transporter ATP-binding protein n=1 Tax=Ramlibacter albus TaxID=2079448 RepID=A0A923S772_9BURK|nr:molybdenum ABC transporter ATP-binding protein [Ramlibacter albus]MBC5766867.1 molybdenum ABC transporter ATP-binding protein [Ramlibacter albus]